MNARILVVEDDEVVRNMFTLYLRDQGYIVDEAEGVAPAQKLLKRHDYDVILTDKNMPGIENNREGGMDLLRYVRSNGLSAEIIMITGHGTLGTAIEAMKLGAFDYMQKPFSIEELREKVARLVQFRQYINPEGMREIYRNIRGEIITLLETSASMPENQLGKAIVSVHLEIDKIFKLFRDSEKIILTLRESLARIANAAERLKVDVPEANGCRLLVEDICRMANSNL